MPKAADTQHLSHSLVKTLDEIQFSISHIPRVHSWKIDVTP